MKADSRGAAVAAVPKITNEINVRRSLRRFVRRSAAVPEKPTISMCGGCAADAVSAPPYPLCAGAASERFACAMIGLGVVRPRHPNRGRRSAWRPSLRRSGRAAGKQAKHTPWAWGACHDGRPSPPAIDKVLDLIAAPWRQMLSRVAPGFMDAHARARIADQIDNLSPVYCVRLRRPGPPNTCV